MCLTITNVFNQLGAKPLKPMIKIDFWYFQWLYYNDVKTFNYSINVLISWFIWATSQEHELEMLEGQHTTGWITLTVSKLHCIVLFCLANKTLPFLSSSLPKTRDGCFFWKDEGSAHLNKLLEYQLTLLLSFHWWCCICQASSKLHLHQIKSYTKIKE